jgi:hypothetical protein
MYSVEEFIIRVFCMVDDELNQLLGGRRLRARGFAPKLSDSELITMEVIGEFLGEETDTAIWKYFRRHWRSLFPALGSRSTFVRQAANLCWIKQMVHARVLERLGALREALYLIDGFPMPVCAFGRAPRAKVLAEHASFGYCAAKRMHYFGLKGHLVTTASGVIVGVAVTAAKVDEREAMWEALPAVTGWLIGDKGYIDRWRVAQLRQERGLGLETVGVRSTMKQTLPASHLRALTSMRTQIETVIGQLATRFHAQHVTARDTWHLTNRLTRKILAHTVAALVLRQDGHHSLRFEQLIAA